MEIPFSPLRAARPPHRLGIWGRNCCRMIGAHRTPARDPETSELEPWTRDEHLVPWRRGLPFRHLNVHSTPAQQHRAIKHIRQLAYHARSAEVGPRKPQVLIWEASARMPARKRPPHIPY